MTPAAEQSCNCDSSRQIQVTIEIRQIHDNSDGRVLGLQPIAKFVSEMRSKRGTFLLSALYALTVFRVKHKTYTSQTDNVGL